MTDKLGTDYDLKTLPAPLTLRQWTDDFQARIGGDCAPATIQYPARILTIAKCSTTGRDNGSGAIFWPNAATPELVTACQLSSQSRAIERLSANRNRLHSENLLAEP